MLKKLTLMTLCIFSICSQSIQSSEAPCISEEMCRSLIKEASKHKVTNKDEVAIACCLGCTACCCLCLSAAGEAQKERDKKVDATTQTDPEKWFPSWNNKNE